LSITLCGEGAGLLEIGKRQPSLAKFVPALRLYSNFPCRITASAHFAGTQECKNVANSWLGNMVHR